MRAFSRDAPKEPAVEQHALQNEQISSSQASRKSELEGLISINPKGFGFVSMRGGQDIFVNKERIAGALSGDRVRVRVLRMDSRGPEGEVVSIVSRNSRRATGTLRVKGRSISVDPDDARVRGPIVINAEQSSGELKDGAFVVVEYLRYPEFADELPEGKVIHQIIGKNPTDFEVQKILLTKSIEEPFPAPVEADANAYSSAVFEREKRRDLTHIPFVTIDPATARDHDDAVWVGRATDAILEEFGHTASYVAYIAIADVSEFVRDRTDLDQEAFRRGCSVYLPDRAIPMLPKKLSSELCSLLPMSIAWH